MSASTISINECEHRRKSLWRIITVILILCGLLLTMVGWALVASQAAAVESRDLRSNLDVHSAEQNGSLTQIEYRLEKIDESLDHNRKLGEDVLEKIDESLDRNRKLVEDVLTKLPK